MVKRIEKFWAGTTARTPVKNRLYDSYPFGWHSDTVTSTCNSNPYIVRKFDSINDNIQTDFEKSLIVPLNNLNKNECNNNMIEHFGLDESDDYDNYDYENDTKFETNWGLLIMLMGFILLYILCRF